MSSKNMRYLNVDIHKDILSNADCIIVFDDDKEKYIVLEHERYNDLRGKYFSKMEIISDMGDTPLFLYSYDVSGFKDATEFKEWLAIPSDVKAKFLEYSLEWKDKLYTESHGILRRILTIKEYDLFVLMDEMDKGRDK